MLGLQFLRRSLFALLVTLVGCLSLAGSSPESAKAPAGDVPFQLPPGFVAERVAGPPLVEHPLMAALDDRGRLFVAESAGLSLPAPDLLKLLPNSIRVLEDTDGDGRYDRGTTFADRMSMPMGVLWLDGVVYSASPPSFWRLEEKGGVAARRSELVTKFGFTGNAADIHGPFLSPDGRLYWTDGRHGHEIKTPDGRIMKGLAARIFRCRPDGSDLEVVCGGGMDDPVEIAFTEEGEPIATVDILFGSPRRIDALIHCVEGGVFPYHPCYKEFKQTGSLLPPLTDLGWVAPSGLMRYRSDHLGAQYRNNLFGAQFNTHKVQRHILERAGASFTARNEDFLVSTDSEFHPTDVLEDADGGLLVVDTGSWFTHCPTSQIAKPGRKGGIYRIRHKGAARVPDPYGLQVKWDQRAPRELAALLDDPRWSVRDQAIRRLARHETAAVPPLREVRHGAGSVRARRNAVWALGRIEEPDARAALREALADKDPGVRQAAIHLAGLNRDVAALPGLLNVVVGDTPPVRREAATALGRMGRPAAVPALLKGLQTSTSDRFLEHALVFALIQIADREATQKGLHDSSPLVRRGALIALDQMDGGKLTADLVTPFLDPSEPALQEAALNVIAARPGWAKEIIGLCRQWLAQDLDPKREEDLRNQLLAFARDSNIQDLVARMLRQDKTPVAVRLLLLEVITRAPLDKLPPTWAAELRWSLDNSDERVVQSAVGALRAAGVTDFDEALLRLARDRTRPEDLRVQSLAAVAPRLSPVESADFQFLLKCLDKEKPPLVRLTAATALGQARLDDEQLETLIPEIAQAGALEMPRLLAAYEHSESSAICRKLLAALSRSPGSSSLTGEALRGTLKRFPAEVQKEAGPLLKRLEVDRSQQAARLAELETLLPAGDSVRGHEVFFGSKAACTACHAVQSQGIRIGPDLSKIGTIRSRRDLLEAIVFPSASFVRGYEPYVIATRAGRLHTGIIARETADAIFLINADRAEIRVPRSSIETIEQGRVSIMPQGLDAQLSRQELADVIAYLQSLK